MIKWARHLLIIAATLLSVVPAGADQNAQLSEEEIQQRLRFIEHRLNEGRTRARLWQYGWSGFFAANTAFQTYMAFESNDSDNETKYTVGAVKSGAALALMLLRPLPAVKGAAPVAAMPTDSPDQKAARLKAAEDLLEANARRARERKSWARHLASIAVHFIGSSAIAVIGDPKDAIISNITGIAFSQAHIWSQPHRAIADLEDYRQTFPDAPPKDELSWELTPLRGGLGVTIRF